MRTTKVIECSIDSFSFIHFSGILTGVTKPNIPSRQKPVKQEYSCKIKRNGRTHEEGGRSYRQ